jgi:hypothetical protein
MEKLLVLIEQYHQLVEKNEDVNSADKLELIKNVTKI